MGILHDDVVIIKHPENEGDDTSVITVNCPDKTGLGCDLCRILLFFGLRIVRVDVSTDGKWCYIVFWVAGGPGTRWNLLKKRLVGACPSCSSASGISFYQEELQPPKPPDLFLLTLWGYDRRGLLHEVTQVLCELELTIVRVKVSTTPDERVMDLFFVTDSRELMHTKKRKEDTNDHLKTVLGDTMISCEIEMVDSDSTVSSQGPSFIPEAMAEEMSSIEINEDQRFPSNSVSITMDNLLSPAHTLVQISCQDRKGLVYDVMRTFKDYNIQISYGRCKTRRKPECELDLFIMQADGRKIVDPSKQNALQSRLSMELSQPLRVEVVSRGPDLELLVANPVELSGRGRPLVFYDITLALKMLNTGIFSAEIGRYMIGGREWEIYRVLLDEEDGWPIAKKTIEEAVWKKLMGWE